MSDGSGLTPEEVAALKRLAADGDLLVSEAKRAEERRRFRGGMAATVSKTNMTERDAKLNGLKGSLESARTGLKNRLDKIESLKEKLPELYEDVARVERQLRDFEEQSKE